jgi:hypothetical protein
MYAALLTWFIGRPDDDPVGTETCSLSFIKYDVHDVNFYYFNRNFHCCEQIRMLGNIWGLAKSVNRRHKQLGQLHFTDTLTFNWCVRHITSDRLVRHVDEKFCCDWLNTAMRPQSSHVGGEMRMAATSAVCVCYSSDVCGLSKNKDRWKGIRVTRG